MSPSRTTPRRMFAKKAADTDVLVAGAGPAGLVAATEAARCGASVLLLERNAQAGINTLGHGGHVRT